jgi:phosphatidylglycerophosphatase A
VAASRGCLRHGGKVEAAVGRKDPGVVVIDEVAGMAATLALLPVLACAIDLRFDHLAGPIPRSLAFALAGGGFFAFRAMDVLKPPPARKLQSLPGGLGVLIDDLVVAPYAAVAAMLALVAWAWWLAPVRA